MLKRTPKTFKGYRPIVTITKTPPDVHKRELGRQRGKRFRLEKKLSRRDPIHHHSQPLTESMILAITSELTMEKKYDKPLTDREFRVIIGNIVFNIVKDAIRKKQK